MKVIITSKDILDLIEGGSPEVIEKVKLVFEDSVKALVASDSLKGQAQQLIESQMRSVMSEALRKTYGNTDITGWAAPVIKEELRKQLNGVHVDKLVYDIVKHYFEYEAKETIQKIIKENLDLYLQQRLTEDVIIAASARAIRNKITKE